MRHRAQTVRLFKKGCRDGVRFESNLTISRCFDRRGEQSFIENEIVRNMVSLFNISPVMSLDIIIIIIHPIDGGDKLAQQ